MEVSNVFEQALNILTLFQLQAGIPPGRMLKPALVETCCASQLIQMNFESHLREFRDTQTGAAKDDDGIEGAIDGESEEDEPQDRIE